MFEELGLLNQDAVGSPHFVNKLKGDSRIFRNPQRHTAKQPGGKQSAPRKIPRFSQDKNNKSQRQRWRDTGVPLSSQGHSS
jgi:hypothetical protein